jgi:phosphohistidine phosphatase
MGEEFTGRREVIKQCAAIPFRRTPEGLEVLIITSSGSRKSSQPKWIVPKGIVDPGNEPCECAEKEALEEAGAVGRIVTPSVGSYDYEKWGSRCVVEVFLMEVSETKSDWPESRMRDRRWCGWEEARSTVKFDGLRKIVARLPVLLAERGLE